VTVTAAGAVQLLADSMLAMLVMITMIIMHYDYHASSSLLLL
jgi:hypothetical protein